MNNVPNANGPTMAVLSDEGVASSDVMMEERVSLVTERQSHIDKTPLRSLTTDSSSVSRPLVATVTSISSTNRTEIVVDDVVSVKATSGNEQQSTATAVPRRPLSPGDSINEVPPIEVKRDVVPQAVISSVPSSTTVSTTPLSKTVFNSVPRQPPAANNAAAVVNKQPPSQKGLLVPPPAIETQIHTTSSGIKVLVKPPTTLNSSNKAIAPKKMSGKKSAFVPRAAIRVKSASPTPPPVNLLREKNKRRNDESSSSSSSSSSDTSDSDSSSSTEDDQMLKRAKLESLKTFSMTPPPPPPPSLPQPLREVTPTHPPPQKSRVKMKAVKREEVIVKHCICPPGATNPDCIVCEHAEKAYRHFHANETNKQTVTEKRNATLDVKARTMAIDENEARQKLIGIHRKMDEQEGDHIAQYGHQKDIIDLWAKHDSVSEVRLTQTCSDFLKPHQLEGIRFLWKNIIVRERRYPTSAEPPLLGCILAHSMGLGKTGQILTFIRLLFQINKIKNAMVLAPKSTLSNWESEFGAWRDRFGVDIQIPLHVVLSQGTLSQKAEITQKWKANGGVIILSYEQYGRLTGSYKGSQMSCSDKVKDTLLSNLRNPGPDIVFCDEGHILRSDKTSVSTALKQIRTNRRVILTGTPLQNNLLEYWAMIDFCLPNYFPKKSFLKYFQTPIMQGQRNDSTSTQIALMKQRSFILMAELKAFVHRKDQTILQQTLPKKSEFIVYCPLSDFQKRVYEDFRTSYLSDPSTHHARGGPSLLYFQSVLNKLGGHPDLLREFLMAKQQALEERTIKDFYDEQLDTSGSVTWASNTLLHPEYTKDNVANSVKLSGLMFILEYVAKNREKVLIFSQFTQTLDFLKKYVSLLIRKNVFRLDGRSSDQDRKNSINQFQQTSGPAAFLISTRAGGVGINLCTAHKAVLFDVSYNPAIDQQAIFRCYRYGLKHPVSIYRLISDGTPEAQIFNSCVSKEWIQKKVIDDAIPSRDNVRGTNIENAFSDLQKEPELPVHAQRMLKQETKRCIESDSLLKHVVQQLQRRSVSINKIMRHESLLLEDKSDAAGQEEQEAYNEYVKVGGLNNVDTTLVDDPTIISAMEFDDSEWNDDSHSPVGFVESLVSKMATSKTRAQDAERKRLQDVRTRMMKERGM
eukprot:TRINITY_DN1216_c2_g1_i3.p1 TRINITY_DN1216_c2_g1~~TRINITY_DN1216_c2_g1_i3.p1  ORF type:complete len:1142 (+),score=220.92 TRINITY_DN1216_c2_g1_i3:187-3612(+)